ncbi:MAG TPA: hypothetical protein VK957_16375 [Lunatimonas sp.]|nr:hypothetical protein [Lunatimonas sp.]
MNKLILISFGLICSSLACFGQNSFKSPSVSSIVGITPGFHGGSVFDFKNVTSDGKSESAVLEGYRQILSSKSVLSPIPVLPEITRSEGSNMPIVDLSKGYFSNFLIKEFSKDFRSNMPITELRIPNLNGFPKE